MSSISLGSMLRRRVAVPLLLRATGSPRWAYWRQLEKTQYLPTEQLLDLQWQRLTTQLKFVYENNEFYRGIFDEHGIKPEQIQSSDDLRRLPVLTKSMIRAGDARIVSRGFDRDELLSFKTGGSTGKPLRILITEECSELRNACAWRHDRWSGWEIGDAVGALWGNPQDPEGFKGRVRAAVLNPSIVLDTMQLNEESVRRFAAEWRRTRPTLLFGHAHSLFLLADMLGGLSIAGVDPRGIISTSMALIPRERRRIEEVLGVQVCDRYGCEEVSLIASECERHSGMHLNIEHLLIEFLDDTGNPVKPGHPGRIVVTDLQNRAMPFIRYAVEDLGVPADEHCACGRGLPLMREVAGRLADFLQKRDGTRVAGISLIENTLTRYRGIRQMQIIQEDHELIRLRLIVEEEFSEGTATELQTYFRDLFDSGTEVRLEFPDSIEPEASGKYRFTICKLPRD